MLRAFGAGKGEFISPRPAPWAGMFRAVGAERAGMLRAFGAGKGEFISPRPAPWAGMFRAVGAVSDCCVPGGNVPRAGRDICRVHIVQGNPTGEGTGPTRASWNPSHDVLFLHRTITSPAPVTPSLGTIDRPLSSPAGAEGLSPGPATRNAWRSPGS